MSSSPLQEVRPSPLRTPSVNGKAFPDPFLEHTCRSGATLPRKREAGNEKNSTGGSGGNRITRANRSMWEHRGLECFSHDYDYGCADDDPGTNHNDDHGPTDHHDHGATYNHSSHYNSTPNYCAPATDNGSACWLQSDDEQW